MFFIIGIGLTIIALAIVIGLTIAARRQGRSILEFLPNAVGITTILLCQMFALPPETHEKAILVGDTLYAAANLLIAYMNYRRD